MVTQGEVYQRPLSAHSIVNCSLTS